MYNCTSMTEDKKPVKRVSLTTTIDPELLQKFRIFCIKEGKPLNYFIEKWISELPEQN